MKEHRTALMRRPLARILVVWAISAASLTIMSFLMESVWVENIGTAFIGAAVIGLVNALLWPLLSRLLLPLAVLTLGLLALVLNAALIWLAAQFVSGFELSSFWAAFWLSLGMAAINMILSSLLTIDDDSAWFRNQVKRRMRKEAADAATDSPGILFLEIDGLALPVLEMAMDQGYAPNMKRWLDSGSHTLAGWETDTSSQTSASQAGLLHGDNSNIPAFRWYDKESGDIVASSDTKALPWIERERSDGNGLLADQGGSRGNLLSGDAPYVMTTASVITDTSRFHTSEFQAYFAHPYNVTRTLFLFFWDVILERRQFRQARRQGVWPIASKKKRGGSYPLVRAAMTVLMRELNINALLGDIFAGRSSAYATFVGYDEVAHHSGILDPGAFDILYKLDAQFGRIEHALPDAPRPYHLVVLSDHGQTPGATFLQRYGFTLEEYVKGLMASEITVGGAVEIGEGWSNLNVLLTDAIRNDDSAASKVVAQVFRGRTVDGEVMLGPEGKAARTEVKTDGGKGEEEPDVIVLASGNLGLISFTEWPQRVRLELINVAYPAVIPGLVQHEGIGFVMVRSEQNGPMVIGEHGIHYLDDDRIEGENPLANFGPNAADHLRRTDGFSRCPDILVNSFYDPETGEGCAFEELIGFHGGMGGYQTQPFILYPAELPYEGELIGAASVFRLCKGWLNELHGDTDGREMVSAQATHE